MQRIVREEIFGPVLVVSKFKDEDDSAFELLTPPPLVILLTLVPLTQLLRRRTTPCMGWLLVIRPAHLNIDAHTEPRTTAVFSRDISRAIGTAHKLHAGTVWVSDSKVR